MSDLQAVNSVFNIEIEKIDPNPNQPRKHFSEEALRDLAESIRRYGVMQPITVVRREHETSGGGMATRYEIVAGERRWRASVIAGMATIPAIIREEEESEQDRFELSVLENLQREDLNPVDKARSFERLVDEFGMRHAEIADKLGKSREYVTNSMRLLDLPDNILDAVSAGEISEGHTRPMLAIKDHPEELQVLLQEIKTKHLTVRQAEATAKALTGKSPRKRQSTSTYSSHKAIDPEIAALQAQLSDTLGTSVSIDTKDEGGKLTIDFFSREDLQKLLDLVDGHDNTTSPAQASGSPAQTQPVQNANTAEESAHHRSFGQDADDMSPSDDDFVITRQSNHQFSPQVHSDDAGSQSSYTSHGRNRGQALQGQRKDIFADSSLDSSHDEGTMVTNTNQVEARQSQDARHDTAAPSARSTPGEVAQQSPDVEALRGESDQINHADTSHQQTSPASKLHSDHLESEDSQLKQDMSGTHYSPDESNQPADSHSQANVQSTQSASSNLDATSVQQAGSVSDIPRESVQDSAHSHDLQASRQGSATTPDSQPEQDRQLVGRNQVQSGAQAGESEVFGVESQPISDLGSDFIPGQAQEEMSISNSSPEDLQIDDQSEQGKTTNQSAPQASEQVARDVQVTMGGMGMMDFMGAQDDQTDQAQNGAQETPRPQSNQDVQSNANSQSQNTNDPYRLDTFSI